VRAVESNGAADGGVMAIETGDGLVLRAQSGQRLAPGSSALVSIRPEKAFLSVQEPASSANCFRVRVEQVAYIGSDTRIIVRLGEDRLFDVWEQNSRSTLDRNEYWQAGESGYLWWPTENALVLAE
jgi:spermidine/putrescine transport system ATP-binding protein